MAKITSRGRTIRPLEYKSRKTALSVAHGAKQPMRVILGDHGRYWVVTPAEAEILVAAGYERA
jgi:hypothetical protein